MQTTSRTIRAEKGWADRSDHHVTKVYAGEDRIGLIYGDLDGNPTFDWTPTVLGLQKYPELSEVRDFVPAPTVEEVLGRVREALGAKEVTVPKPDGRPEPRLSTDYCGELYIVVDDEGEPQSEYQSDPNVAHRLRNRIDPGHRIYRACYRIIDENPVVHDAGTK